MSETKYEIGQAVTVVGKQHDVRRIAAVMFDGQCTNPQYAIEHLGDRREWHDESELEMEAELEKESGLSTDTRMTLIESGMAVAIRRLDRVEKCLTNSAGESCRPKFQLNEFVVNSTDYIPRRVVSVEVSGDGYRYRLSNGIRYPENELRTIEECIEPCGGCLWPDDFKHYGEARR